VSLASLVGGALSVISGGIFDSGTRDGEASFTHTRVFASFHSDQGFDGAVSDTPNTAEKSPFRIVGFQTSTSFGAGGQWTLTVKPSIVGTDLLETLWEQPEDVWVRIVTLTGGKPTDVLFGLIDTFTEDLKRDNLGARSVTYTITGRDFQKVFTDTQFYINIYEGNGAVPLTAMYDVLSAAQKMNKGVGLTADVVVRTLINAWLGNGGLSETQWMLPKSLGARSFHSLLYLEFDAPTRGQINDPAIYSPDQFMFRDLWGILEEYNNGVLNEMFCSLADDQDIPFSLEDPPRATLTLRERPFPSTDKGKRSWEQIRTHNIKPGDVFSRTMSLGAPESTFNYWLLESAGNTGMGLDVLSMIQQGAARSQGVPGGVPIYDVASMKKHGFRRFSQSTRYFSLLDDQNWIVHVSRWLELLYDWYAVVPFELSGTLTTSRLLPKIRIGHKLHEARKNGKGVTYYVEGVTHAWQYPGAGKTTLNLTRGEYDGRDLLDQVNQASATAKLAFVKKQLLEDLFKTPLALTSIPHGSGVRLDKQVGQEETPEQMYLRRMGVIGPDPRARREGELDDTSADRLAVTSPGSLPDQQVGDAAEQAVGQRLAPARTQGSSTLSERDLEAGVPLPTQDNIANPESNALDADARELRDRKRRR